MPEVDENKVVVVEGQQQPANVTELTGGVDVLRLAEEADARVNALNKVMTASLKVTTPHDWVIIGGKPYLQESGCTKVASLLGISFEIVQGFPLIETDSFGYKTYTYRVRALGRGTYVEGEGQRSMKEEFFVGKGDSKKAPEQIKDRDVRIAALTNAKANAIKSIIPNLKNLEIETLEAAGIDISKIQGYTFKQGAKGGKTEDQKETFKCEGCGKEVNQKTASFSQSKFSGHIYCFDCQQKAAANKLKKTGEVVDLTPQDSEEGE